MFYDAERSGIEYANCVDAGFSYIETAVAHGEAARHDAAEGTAAAVLKARPHKGGELGVGQQMASVSTHLDDSVVVSKGDEDLIIGSRDSGGGCATDGFAGSLADFCAESQLCGDDGVPSIVHIAGPQGTSADRVFIAEAGNLFSFGDDAVACRH